MAYRVDDRVSWYGDLGTIWSVDLSHKYPYIVHFDDGTYKAFGDYELEAAE